MRKRKQFRDVVERGTVRSTPLSEVEKIVVESFDKKIWFVTKCCLSVSATLLIKDAVNPAGLNLVGPPSETKSTILSMFYGNKELVYVSDDFSPRAFVSLAANMKESKLKEIDLLPKIVGKVLIVPELAPIFQGRPDDVQEKFTVLTRVFDGEGLRRDGGTGSRGYDGDCTFAWLGATTPFPRSVWALMGKLGSRMLFLEMPISSDGEAKVARVVNNLLCASTFRERRERCREVLNRFLESLWERTGGFRGVQWKRGEPEENLVNWVAKVSRFVCVARSITVDDRVVTEAPDRLAAILYSVARGHALINGRDFLTDEDLTPVVEIALCSMPDDRRQVVRALLNSSSGVVTSAEAQDALRVIQPKASRPTARKLLETLGVLGVGDYQEGSGPKPDTLTLAQEFQWALSEKFRSLRAPEMLDENSS